MDSSHNKALLSRCPIIITAAITEYSVTPSERTYLILFV